MMIRLSLIVTATIAALSTAVFAQGSSHGGHGRHSTPMQTQQSTDSPATRAYREANAKMHSAMDIPFTGDADVDFVRSMIPHHQGAMDMAKIALANTKDEQVRKWATDVLREQEREIAEMRAWLQKKGVR